MLSPGQTIWIPSGPAHDPQREHLHFERWGHPLRSCLLPSVPLFMAPATMTPLCCWLVIIRAFSAPVTSTTVISGSSEKIRWNADSIWASFELARTVLERFFRESGQDWRFPYLPRRSRKSFFVTIPFSSVHFSPIFGKTRFQ